MPNWQLIIDAVGIGVSAILTFVLIILYRKQTNLNEYEMNRDARQIHTDVLRERVRYWLGETDKFTRSNWEPQSQRMGEDSTRLPTILLADVEPAPDDQTTGVSGLETEFRVLPAALKNDRYMTDFLENHADDVDESVSQLNNLYEEFESNKEEFIANCPDGETCQTARYRIEPIPDMYEQWLFQQVVSLTRERDSKDELKSTVETGVKDTAGTASDDRITFLQGPTDRSNPIYQCELETIGLTQYNEENLSEDIEPLVVEALHSAIQAIDLGEAPYDKARKAGDLLEQMEQEVDDLEQTLIIYEGRPLYQGDCEYLQEARV